MVLQLTYSNLEFPKFSREDPRILCFLGRAEMEKESAGRGERQGVGMRGRKLEGDGTKDAWGGRRFPKQKFTTTPLLPCSRTLACRAPFVYIC